MGDGVIYFYLFLLECIEDIDATINHGYVIYNQGETVLLDYPSQGDNSTYYGRSFHYGRFVMKLRERLRFSER
jgi:squalene monooxygenase